MIHARSIASQLEKPTVFYYNSIIRRLVNSRHPVDALFSYRKMLEMCCQPNKFTFPFVVKACTEISDPRWGILVHNHIVQWGLEADPYIRSSLIHMYISGKDSQAAHKLLDKCPQRDVVSWNSMIDGYVKCGEMDKAMAVFDRMEYRDVVSWNTMISGFASIGYLAGATELFNQMPERSMVSWNSVLSAYAKCGDVGGAWRTFQAMPQKDIISWNTMLACYTQNGQYSDALCLFDQMQASDMKPTEAALVSLLSACSHLGALDRGMKLHKYICDYKIELNVVLSTVLADMYAKCGSLPQALQVFYSTKCKDVLSWNTIIAGMAVHGHAKEALQLFIDMQENGFRPDDITFVALLNACSHSGMVDEGYKLIKCMSQTYGIKPKVEHYGCMVDLLSRTGLVDEAVNLIQTMPMKPNADAWGAVLGGCRIHKKFEVGEHAGKILLDLQPRHCGRYVLLSNLYAAADRWDDVRRVRERMKQKGVKKLPGLSRIEVKGAVHQFFAGDCFHPESLKIYSKLSEIISQLKTSFGYMPDTREALFDIEEEEKEQCLYVHSEKLAIAYGLMHINVDATIRVVKNLRICRDCHYFAKMVSEVYDREVSMRDRNRFHHFRRGKCSCMDYW